MTGAMSEEKPLVSMTLVSYNQERYVEQAVRGVLAQTYAPLEVVISDDGSTDRTYEIARRVVAELAEPEAGTDWYRMPGKRILVRRNAVNEGIMLHCHRVFAMTTGAYIIPSAGDDVSEPRRVETVVRAWLKSGKAAAAVLHQAQKYTPEGRMVGPLPPQSLEAPLGCGTNYRRDVIARFPPVTVVGSADDWVYVRRARMLGEVAFLPDELVRYRVGSGVSSVLHDNRGPALRSQKGILRSLEQSQIDLDAVASGLDPAVVLAQRREIEAARRKAAAYVELLTAESMARRYRAFRTMDEKRLKGKLLQFAYVLPKWMADAVIGMYLRIKN